MVQMLFGSKMTSPKDVTGPMLVPGMFSPTLSTRLPLRTATAPLNALPTMKVVVPSLPI